jgi:low affinity Fe/Cu permease
MDRLFTHLANTVARWMGHYASFLVAVALIAAWATSGPVFRFSEAWQLTVNTGTTIVTFLMVFLIQNTQNRDSAALHVKLDALIRATEQADDALMLAEDATTRELSALRDDLIASPERTPPCAG